MNDHRKTKSQLIEELQQARQALAELTAAEAAQRQAEAELRAREAALKRFVEYAPAAVAMFDTELRYLAASRRWIADYQLDNRPLIGVSHYEIFPEIGEDWKAIHRRCLAGAIERREEDPFPRADGSLDWVSWEVQPWYLADERIGGLIIFTEVITQRKQLEEALRVSEANWRALVEVIPDYVSLHDEEGRFLFLNHYAAGFTEQDVIGSSVFQYLSPESVATFKSGIEQSHTTGKMQKLEHKAMGDHGLMRDYEDYVVPIGDGGAASKTLLISKDVTERKQAESQREAMLEALRDNQELFSLLMRHSPIYAFIKESTPTTSRVLQASENYQQMIGLSGRDMIGKTMDELFPPEAAAKFTADDWAVVSTGEVLTLDEELNGRHYTTIKFPIIQEERTLLAGYTIDITERKQAEAGRQALLEIMQGLVVTQDLPGFLHLVQQAIARVIYAENFFVILYNPATALFEEVYAVDKFDQPAAPSPLQDSISAYVFRTGQPLLLTQARFDELAAQGEVKLVGTDSLSWLGVPLKTSRQTIGVMVVQDYDQLDRYSARDTEFLVSIAGQVALAVERRQAEAVVRDLNRYNRSLLEVSLDPLITIGWEGKITDVNTAMEKATGYTRQALIGTDFSKYFTEPARAQAVYRQVFRAGQVHDYELELRHRTGTITSVLYNASVYRDDAGQVIGVFAAARDITDRKRVEARLRRFWDLPLVGMAITSPDRLFLDVNQKLADMLGYPATELTGMSWVDVTYPDDVAENIRLLAQTLAGEIDEYQMDKRFIRRDGSLLDTHIAVRCIRRADGRVDHLALVVQDITERKRAESQREAALEALHLLNATLEQRVHERTLELQAANARLTELDRLKDEFISRIGHELRTPLVNVKLYLKLLETGQPEKRENYLTTLKREADRLHVLIEDVLQFSQISTPADVIGLGPLDLNQLIETRQSAWCKIAPRPEVVFELRLAPNLPPVKLDGELFVQALTRLVTNALSYTHAGAVTITTAQREKDGRAWLTVSVQDTGPGITPDELPHLFERFYRGRAAADYKTPGTGIGLSISREIMEKLGGRLTVDTTVGAGSTFTLWLPAV